VEQEPTRVHEAVLVGVLNADALAKIRYQLIAGPAENHALVLICQLGFDIRLLGDQGLPGGRRIAALEQEPGRSQTRHTNRITIAPRIDLPARSGRFCARRRCTERNGDAG
jgi:hypothetical protein